MVGSLQGKYPVTRSGTDSISDLSGFRNKGGEEESGSLRRKGPLS